MKRVRRETEIAASPSVVWHVLTELRFYPEWNPFISAAAGRIRIGDRLRIRIRSDGSGSITLHPKVVRADPDRELRWLGHAGVPALLNAEHRFRIEPLSPGRVRFVQEQEARGLLVPFLAGWLGRILPRGIETMNAALKARAEESFYPSFLAPAAPQSGRPSRSSTT